ncbi:Replication factor C subunit 3 [Micractinium conductrix]|uniref:Replication factor C subunit 3 n=1 Tax=Micractinium conductrix TaxID=554055 RepID=A0A2P6VAB9_9CHLO|nr:Replication factor C subunit 3 [Micractinium conductrix]|eukprot:PSC71036.1 Replication factor C subunit 3 [Micractinium conductrix]
MLYVDKYRPKALEQFELHRDVAENLQKLVAGGDCPHTLFYGPPGAGKKTLILALLREIYGAGVEKLKVECKPWKIQLPTRTLELEFATVSSSYHVELNPSDVGNNDRFVVQEIIKEMAKSRPIGTDGRQGFKVLVLNEVDRLSKEAQHSLRRTMEKYSAACRLVLCCNNVSKVIEPVRSRCLCIRVAAPSDEAIAAQLGTVAAREKVELPQALAQKIAEASERNLRRALLSLEACRVECYPFKRDQEVASPDWELYIQEIAADVMQEQSPKRLFQVRGKLYELLVNCIPPEVVLRRLAQALLPKLDDEVKHSTAEDAAFYEHRMQEGSKPIFHLEAFLARFMSNYKQSAPLDLESAAELEADYTLGEQIGRGSFAVVLEVTDTRSGRRLAAKKLPKFVHGRQASQQAAVVAAEAGTQAALGAVSPAVLRLVDVRQEDSYFYLISELCSTDLARYLDARGGAPLHERSAAFIVLQLLSALAACHHAGVAFRDVKPANLLVRGIDANGLPEICLADFGCARPTGSGRSSAGTPLYSAPECIDGVGGIESDVWSAGIMLFHLLSGCFPFCASRQWRNPGRNEGLPSAATRHYPPPLPHAYVPPVSPCLSPSSVQDPQHKISQGEYWRRLASSPIHTSGPAWHSVSPVAIALVRRMLDRNCSSRITAEEALQDPWLLDMTSSRAASWQHAVRGATPLPKAQHERVVGNVVGLPQLGVLHALHTTN